MVQVRGAEQALVVQAAMHPVEIGIVSDDHQHELPRYGKQREGFQLELDQSELAQAQREERGEREHEGGAQ